MSRLFSRFALFTFLLSTSAPGLVAVGDFSLEQILDYPFPSEMTVSPSGQSVAWVFNQQGARNIWLAEAPDFVGRQLTTWNLDDGYTISQLVFSPDDKSLFFVRGDGANRQGELPNPRHIPDGVKQAIWQVGTAEGPPKLLAEGSSPLPIPDGNGILFVVRGEIHQLKLQDEAASTPLIQSRGSASSLRWSPDGQRLAYVSNRGDHSFIGVYDWNAKKQQYLSPTVDRDSDPVWSPSGDRLAFRRTPARRQNPIFAPLREAQPWSIHIHEFESGKTHQIWRAESGPGSAFHALVTPNQLFWSADDFIIFPWERTGWTLLYSMPAKGGATLLLTPGEFEVERVELSHDRRHLVYNSNQNDIDRRHIWQVAARGGPPRQLTRGQSSEWDPAPLAEERLAFIQASGKSPPQPYLLSASETRRLAEGSLPENFPERHLVEPQQIVFDSADGMRIHGQLFLPSGDGGRRHPAMLYFHGGSRRQMLLGWHYSSYYANCYAMNQYLANQGYVVLSVNYRSGIGYGLEFREALNYGATGASEFNDVLGAGIYLRSRPDVDPERIGLWGGSYGGYLTALGLARASDLFAAGVDVHGVHDWNPVIQNFVPSYNPLEDPARTRLAFESSPMASLNTWRSPVLLIHGDDDRNVPFSESVNLAEGLRERDVYFEQLVFPDEVHGFLLQESWLKAFEAAADFLDRMLVQKGQKPPS